MTGGYFKVTNSGIEYIIPTMDPLDPSITSKMIIPREIFIEAFQKFIVDDSKSKKDCTKS